MSQSIRVPSDLPLGEAPAKAVQSLITDFLQAPPSRINNPDSSSGELVRVPVPTRDVIALKRLGVSPEQAVWSQWCRDRGGEDAATGAVSGDDDTPPGFRPEQARYWRGIRSALESRDHPIVAAEGSTGLGKGRVLATVADEHADQGVVVGAPTLQVLGQLMAEFRLISDRRVSFVLGRGQFVSVRQLELMAEEDEDLADTSREAIREWIKAGGPAASPHTAIFHEIDPALCWLMEDLAHLVPDVPLPPLSDADDGEDPAQLMYQRLRYTRNPEADNPDAPVPGVTFASHSAIAWDARLRATEKGALIPPFDLLVLDEAHEFVGAVESTFSSSVAFRGLTFILSDEAFWRRHKRLGAARQASILARDLVDEMRVVGWHHRDGAPLDEVLAAYPSVRRRMEALRSALKPLAHRHPGVQTGFAAVSDALTGSTRTLVQFSSVMRYPGVVSGPKSLKFFFDSFWETVPRALLASATLLLPNTVTGQGDPGHLLTTLHIPSYRLDTLRPVTTRWLYDPELTVVSPERTDLIPPQESVYETHEGFEAAKEGWYTSVAEEIESLHDTAKGGVLVLLPGYEPIAGIASALAESGRVVIEQTPGAYRTARREFMARAELGERPIWLATGPAWTGMDVKSDRPPAEDYLLTDLVVPRLPFGVDRSSVHLNRMRFRKSAERDRAAFQFRQGLGRLMRAEGLRDRRIWILDARLHNKRQAWLMAPFWSICRKYD